MPKLGSSYVPRPGSLLFSRLDGYLWILTPVVAVAAPVGIVKILPPNVLKSYTDHLLLSLAVYCVPLLWAFWLAARGRRAYAREWQLLDRTRDITLKDRAELTRPNSPLRDDHEKLIDASHYFGTHATEGLGEELISERMVQQALRNARELRRDGDIVTQIYLRDLSPARAALRVPQVVALRLGILFSFVFLLIGLQPLASMAPTAQAFTELVPQMINGLTAAFTSSVGGIGAALVIQLLVVIVDRDYLIVARLLESTWMDLAHTLTQLRLKGDLPATVDRLQAQLATHGEELRETRSTVRDQVAEAERLMKENDARFAEHIRGSSATQEALEKLATSHQSRIDHLEKIVTRVGEYEDRWAKVFDKRLQDALANQDHAFTKLREFQEQAWKSLNSNITSIGTRLPDEIKSTLRDESSGLHQTVLQLKDSLEQYGKQMRESVDRLANVARTSPAPNPDRRRAVVLPVAGAVLVTLIVIYSMLFFLGK